MDRTLIHELSSDDEVGFDNSSAVDNFDWLNKLFDDVGGADDDDHPICNGGFFNLADFYGGGGGGGGCGDKVVDDDDSDDVVVVGEVIVEKPKKAKILLPRIDDDEDDCVVLDGDPDKPKPKDDVKESEEDSDDLLIVGEKGQVACRDYPHPRHLCAKFPFSSAPHESRCDLCHCYVCDSLAPCSLWGSGVSPTDHCHATDKEERWKLARKGSRQLKNPLPPLPVTKPSAGSQPQLPQFQQTPVPPTFGLPNIIRNQRSSVAVSATRFQPQLVSQQRLRNCNRNFRVQGNRGSSLAPRMVNSRPIFKRSSRPVVANQPTYHAPNNVSIAYLQLPDQHSRETFTENNSANSIVSSLQLDSDSSFCVPSTSTISPVTSPLQLQGHSLPSPHIPTSHFHGGHSAAVASNSPYAYTSMNQVQNVPSLVLHCNTNAQNSITACSELHSAVTQNISAPNFSCSIPDVLSSVTQRSHQTSAERSYSNQMFLCSMSNGLENVSKSYQQSAAENSLVPDGVPQHEYLPSIEQNVQPSENTDQLEFDFENWLQDGESVLNSQDPFLLGINNQASVPAPVDAGMLYFDFETSWKGLTHL